MKFTLELPIARSQVEVWKAFDNPENTKIWQPTLIKFEAISGKQGQPGAVSRLTYAEGKREFFLTEKVTFRAESDRFDGVYENDFADNSVKNTFVGTGNNETLWKIEVEFKFKTFLMKIVRLFAKKNFVKRTKETWNTSKSLRKNYKL